MNGIKTMGYGGFDQTWLQAAQVWNETWSDWNEGWTADWVDKQWTEDWPGLVKNPSKNMQAVASDPRTVKFSHWF